MVLLGSARLLRCIWISNRPGRQSAAAARRGIGAAIRRSSSISMAMPSRRRNLTALCSGPRNPGPGITAEPSSVRNARKNVKDEEFVPDKKLADLRKLMSDSGVQAYIVPSEDAHQSEFIAECFTRRAYISGFTGSAETSVITLEKAALWTDGRYYLQENSRSDTSLGKLSVINNCPDSTRMIYPLLITGVLMEGKSENADLIRPIFNDAYGKEQANVWMGRWKFAEMYKFGNGQQWLLSQLKIILSRYLGELRKTLLDSIPPPCSHSLLPV
ncbi:hypothetical protein SELMODRAFT_439238 [Selaginella moellendorffii]|uniref:Creatinase N-terminal domain-containing protein n=1 Tax=Selaginella moellendorffii TaxID=88036 RepID=D8R2Z7_SELML|nr:hypothetical protein SELMODRAFT_439238 [Selaginella moellendorffii]